MTWLLACIVGPVSLSAKNITQRNRHIVISLRAFGRSGYCDHKRRGRRRGRRRRRHTFVPRQNLRTAIGIDLLFFLNDWYE